MSIAKVPRPLQPFKNFHRFTPFMGAADTLWATAREVVGIDLVHRSQRGRVISGLHGVHTIGAAFSPFAGG